MIRVGIFGASGYMGGEALRVLLEHPAAEIAWLTSRSGERVDEVHPNLFGLGLEMIHPDAATPCDVAFLALPTAPSIEAAARMLAQGCKVIDLGAAFRLEDRATWESVYGQSHPHWPLAEEAVYGIPELKGEQIAKARLVANPGCFSSAAILALAPLVRERLVDLEHLVVDGLSGTTGVGAEEIGLKMERGYIIVDDLLRTSAPGISAVGDVITFGPGKKPHAQLAHLSSAEGILVAERLAGHDVRPINYDHVPGCTYCDPEIGSVGLTEAQAKERGYDVAIGNRRAPSSTRSPPTIPLWWPVTTNKKRFFVWRRRR